MGRRFTSADLKLLAMGMMAADHAAVVFLYRQGRIAVLPVSGIYTAMRLLGRMAFPLFAFLLVEGFFHTRDYRRYAARLLAAAVLSEIPFDLVMANRLFDPGKNNTLFLLLIGLLTMQGLSRAADRKKREGRIRTVLAASAGFTAAWLFRVDYGPMGLLLILIFYFLRNRPAARTNLGCLAAAFLGGPGDMNPFACLAFFFINRYSGGHGRRLGYLPYFFYPLHLCLLYLAGGIIHGTFI